MANLAEKMRYLEQERKKHVATSVTKAINLLSNEQVNGAYGDVNSYLPELAPRGKQHAQDDENARLMFKCFRAEAKPWLTLDCGRWQPVITFIQEALDDGAPYGNVMQVLLQSQKYPDLEQML